MDRLCLGTKERFPKLGPSLIRSGFKWIHVNCLVTVRSRSLCGNATTWRVGKLHVCHGCNRDSLSCIHTINIHNRSTIKSGRAWIFIEWLYFRWLYPGAFPTNWWHFSTNALRLSNLDWIYYVAHPMCLLDISNWSFHYRQTRLIVQESTLMNKHR